MFKKLLNILILVNFNWFIIFIFNFYTKKLYYNFKIFYIKLFAKVIFNYKNILFIIFGDNKIIDIESNIYIFIVSIFVNKDIKIKLALLKVKVN